MGSGNPVKSVTNTISSNLDSLINPAISGATAGIKKVGKFNLGNTLGDIGALVSPVLSGTTAALQNAGGVVSEGLKGANQNVTRNLADLSADLAVAGSGNFNNLGQTLLKQATTQLTAGLVNPDDLKKVMGNTGSQRFRADQTQKATDAAAADAQAVIDAQNRDVANTIQGVVTANKATPGRRQTLINGPSGSGNTLLTLIGA